MHNSLNLVDGSVIVNSRTNSAVVIAVHIIDMWYIYLVSHNAFLHLDMTAVRFVASCRWCRCLRAPSMYTIYTMIPKSFPTQVIQHVVHIQKTNISSWHIRRQYLLTWVGKPYGVWIDIAPPEVQARHPVYISKQKIDNIQIK